MPDAAMMEVAAANGKPRDCADIKVVRLAISGAVVSEFAADDIELGTLIVTG
jgi:hypothetical protein